MFGFELSQKHEKLRVQGHLIEVYIWHTLGTQVEDQNQAQDEDEF